MRKLASFADVEQREDRGWRVYSVKDPNSLTQVVGWLKFTCENGMVLYRGQSKLHDDMTASGFRNLTSRSHADYAAKMKSYVASLYGSECTCRANKNFASGHQCTERLRIGDHGSRQLVSGTYRAAVEPLLQHYGLKTRWIDVVDNIWIALWFACHEQVTDGSHAHHRRRSTAQEGPDAKAYIVIFESGDVGRTDIPGYYLGDYTRIVDLRYAVPSVYLRPHAQHGALIAPAKIDTAGSAVFGSMKSQVPAVIEIRLGDALEWLGTGAMTSVHVLFPPATKDLGFRRLLDSPLRPHKKLGYVTKYGPGS